MTRRTCSIQTRSTDDRGCVLCTGFLGNLPADTRNKHESALTDPGVRNSDADRASVAPEHTWMEQLPLAKTTGIADDAEPLDGMDRGDNNLRPARLCAVPCNG